MTEVFVSQLRIPARADVVETAAIIGPHIRHTPILRTPAEDFGLSGMPITFKLEFLQHAGVFKARGAFANILMREGAENGVVAASGGNHGAAVAYAAMKLGHKARIFVPSISSPAKIARIKSYGADIVVGGATYADAHAASREWAAEHGGLECHAFDAFETVCGQGTLSLEFAEQAPDLDTVLVAVGGGGLVAGAAAYYGDDVKIVGVEPFNAPSLNHALAAGHPVDAPVSGVAADSLGARRIGDIVFPLAQKYVAASLLVTDEAIINAQKTLWDVLRVVAEPGGAAAMAALLSGAYVPAPGEKVGVVLCGANTTAVSFA